MECGVHASGTFNGNAVGTAAALATIAELEKKDTYENLNQIGAQLVGGIKDLGRKHGIKLYSEAVSAICIMEFGIDRPLNDFRDCLSSLDQTRYAQVVSMSEKYGVRFSDKRGRIYLSTQHTQEDINRTLEVLDQVFQTLK